MPSLNMRTFPLVSTTTMPSTVLSMTFWKKVLDSSTWRSSLNLGRDIPGRLDDLNDFAFVVEIGAMVITSKRVLPVFIQTLLVGAQQALFLELLQSILQKAKMTTFSARLVQTVACLMAGPAQNRVLFRYFEVSQEGRFTVSTVMSKLTTMTR